MGFAIFSCCLQSARSPRCDQDGRKRYQSRVLVSAAGSVCDMACILVRILSDVVARSGDIMGLPLVELGAETLGDVPYRVPEFVLDSRSRVCERPCEFSRDSGSGRLGASRHLILANELSASLVTELELEVAEANEPRDSVCDRPAAIDAVSFRRSCRCTSIFSS